MDKTFFVQFLITIIVVFFFGPMNVLVYRFSDLYFSKSLVYAGMLVASNMVWSQEIAYYLTMGKFNVHLFIIGVILSVMIAVFLLRGQYGIKDKQWLKGMIRNYSESLTTTNVALKRTKDPKIKKLGKRLIETNKKEIQLMKSYLD